MKESFLFPDLGHLVNHIQNMFNSTEQIFNLGHVENCG